jgi:hypothetical protein
LATHQPERTVNKLQLVQRLAEEVGMARVPTTTVGQVGEFKRICNWVDSAVLKIEGDQERRWSWMWEQPTLTLPADTFTIAGTLQASRYVLDSMRDLTDSNEFPPYLQYLPWQDFNHCYPRILVGPTNTFTSWTVRPDKAIVFNGIPPETRTLQVERYRAPRALVDDTDEPGFDEDLHLLVVWTAMVYYASFDEAGVQRATAQEERAKLFDSLVGRSVDQMVLGAPMV